jgi:hypothetical protein
MMNFMESVTKHLAQAVSASSTTTVYDKQHITDAYNNNNDCKFTPLNHQANKSGVVCAHGIFKPFVVPTCEVTTPTVAFTNIINGSSPAHTTCPPDTVLTPDSDSEPHPLAQPGTNGCACTHAQLLTQASKHAHKRRRHRCHAAVASRGCRTVARSI